MASHCARSVVVETAIPKEFSHPLHAKCMLTQLNESRKNPRLCDGIVIIEGREIPVQRNILAAASPFFRALYSYGSEPGTADCGSTVHVDHVSTDTFMQIIDYIYTSVISLTEDNIQDVLQAADVLLISHLKDLCCDFLEQCVSAANCLGICEFTERFTCPHVHAVVTQFMDENFREVSFTEEFLLLPNDRLQAILQRDSLVVRSEDVVFDAILRWVEYDQDARLAHLEALLKNSVRFRCLDYRFIQECVDHKLIQCCHLEDALPSWKEADTVSHRRGYMTMLVVCGGERLTNTSSGHGDGQALVIENCVRAAMFQLSSVPGTCRWLDLAPMLQCRANHAVVVACGFLFAVGGRDGTNTALKTGEKYDPCSNSWSVIAPMSQSRMSFGLVAVDDKLYALGGCQQTTSMEEYDIHMNKWRSLPSMNLQRRWCAHAVCQKKIYVLGGSVTDQSYEVVECFDPRTEMWSSVAPMRERRDNACAVGFSEFMYVFGGYRRYMCPSAMHQGEPPRKFCETEVYSSEYECWQTVGNTGMCSMTPDCFVAAALRADDEVVIVGQLKLNRGYQFVRAYRPATDSWRGILINRPAVGQQRHYQCALLKMPAYLTQGLLYEQDLLTDLEKDHYSGLTKIPDISFFDQQC